MATEEEGVRHTRMLQSFEDFQDCELVYGALEAAKLFVERVEPTNEILKLLGRAIDHRSSELRDTYEAQSQGWKRNPG
jgi:hypothetical protein